MRVPRQNFELIDLKPPRVLVPSEPSGRLVDEKRNGVGVIDSDAAGADAEPAGQGLERRLRGELSVEPDRDRPLGGQRGRFLVERLDVREAEVPGVDREGWRVSVGGLHRDCPWARGTGRRHDRVRPRARMIEHDREIAVGDGAIRRIAIDLETAVGEGQPVERLRGAGHRFGGGADEGGEVAGASRRRGRARQGNRRRARIIGDRKRERAVGRDAQAQVKSVELEAPDLDLGQGERVRVEADFAARRREDRPPVGIAYGQAFETETHAPRIVHEVGRSEGDCVAVAGALLQRGFRSGRAGRPAEWARAPASRPAPARPR